MIKQKKITIMQNNSIPQKQTLKSLQIILIWWGGNQSRSSDNAWNEQLSSYGRRQFLRYVNLRPYRALKFNTNPLNWAQKQTWNRSVHFWRTAQIRKNKTAWGHCKKLKLFIRIGYHITWHMVWSLDWRAEGQGDNTIQEWISFLHRQDQRDFHSPWKAVLFVLCVFPNSHSLTLPFPSLPVVFLVFLDT